MNALAVSLFAVFVVAKGVALWGRTLPPSPWAPFAYIWQDAAVALGFLLAAHALRSIRVARAAYAALVVLAAVSACVARVLGSPLTTPMVRAARGALSDSVVHTLTIPNIAALALVLGAGAFAPWLLRSRIPRGRELVIAGAMLVVIGPLAAARVDSGGLERNSSVALVTTAFPRVGGSAMTAAWRDSPYARRGVNDDALRPLRASARGMNVLLVVLESTAARYLRPWGATADPMPNLSTLADQSALFENAYAVYPESIKGFVAILASRYPAFDVPAERHAWAMRSSLASLLAGAGYETALFHSGRFMYLGMDAVVAHAGFALAEDAGDIGGNRNSSFGTDESATVQRTLAWIDARSGGKPFFAAYLPIAGHHPYASYRRGPFSDSTELGRYQNALHEGDAALGELLSGLRARGLGDRTMVVVIADHGEAFGQHEGNYGHTLALYEENLRVPFLISVPAVSPVPTRVTRAVSLLDLAPTVLDIVGIEAPKEFDGESLLDGRARMSLFFTDYSMGLLGLRDGCSKLITELQSRRSRLFDVCRDPSERNDLASREPERVARYGSLLRDWSAAQVARIRSRTVEMAHAQR